MVIGVGRSGLATIEVLKSRGITVFAYDDKPAQLLAKETYDTLNRLGAPLRSANDLDAVATEIKAAIVSPGVPLTHKAVTSMYDRGLPVISEIELAYMLASGPIIAVTGSKGKSTTTALIGHSVARRRIANRVGGNIGNPLMRETAAAPKTNGSWPRSRAFSSKASASSGRASACCSTSRPITSIATTRWRNTAKPNIASSPTKSATTSSSATPTTTTALPYERAAAAPCRAGRVVRRRSI